MSLFGVDYIVHAHITVGALNIVNVVDVSANKCAPCIEKNLGHPF
ncbi:MAG: hypothetical protein WDZ52_12620 [Pseudohongiellaceae bacterium]